MADIIFFAIVAVFIISRLYSTFGKKDGDFEKKMEAMLKPHDAPSMKEVEGEVITVPEPEKEVTKEVEKAFENEKLAEDLRKIKAADSSFSAAMFLSGARMAFEMALKAFDEGDKNTLKDLLSAEVYGEFSAAIKKRESAKKREFTTLVAINSANISSASMVRNKARIVVKFESEQISVTKNNEGEIVDGDSSQIDVVKDSWTFEHDVRSSNPNWIIIST